MAQDSEVFRREQPGLQPGVDIAPALRRVGVVRKFGGTSVMDGARIREVARLIEELGAGGSLVVVSAMAGVTDALLGLGEEARRGAIDEAQRLAARLAQRHHQAIVDLQLTGGDGRNDAGALTERALHETLEASLLRWREIANGAALLGDLSPKSTDELLATGEMLSSRLLAAALEARGVEVRWVDPREVLITDSRFGRAEPDVSAIRERAREILSPPLMTGATVVTGGFVGAARSGETTTLGRGGSDLSAALLAAAIGAPELEIWTDVDGVMTADPRQVPEARRVPVLSYAEASELAFFGAKVLHPATLRPAVTAGIPVRIRNTFAPNGEGTRIAGGVAGAGVTAISARGGAAALFLTNPRMLLAPGHAARVFAVFERHGVAVDVIATSDVSISVTVDRGAPLGELVRELGDHADVAVERGLAVVSIVGRRLRTTPRLAARVFTAIDDVNVVLISQGASDTSLSFVVREDDAATTLARLHAALFPPRELV
ncbi:MAG: aspartate kinase [Acidobacteriota bacterium]